MPRWKIEVWLPLAVAAVSLAGALAWVRARALPPPSLARVVAVDGAASSGGHAAARLAPGDAVGAGERLSVEDPPAASASACLVLALPDGRTRVAVHGDVELLQLRPLRLFLHEGAVAVDGAGSVLTREADAATTDGRFTVRAGRGFARVDAARGTVAVEGRGKRSALGADQHAEVAAPGVTPPAAPDPLARLVNDRLR